MEEKVIPTVEELPMPAAALWDMDGTLIDSDGLWVAAEREVHREARGLALPADVERACEGASLPECARVLRAAGVTWPAESIMERLVESVERALTDGGAIPWAVGALDLLRVLMSHDVPCVLVTGTPMRIVRHVLAAIPYDANAFAGAATAGASAWRAITGDSPLPAKPSPDRYLAAARMTGVDIHDCLVFEDSGTGLSAALASGAKVVAVTDLARVPAPEDPRYRRIRNFRDLVLR